MKNMIYKSVDSELDVIAKNIKNNLLSNNKKFINNKNYFIKVITSSNNTLYENNIAKRIYIPFYNKKDAYNFRLKISKEILDIGQDKWGEVLFRVKIYKLNSETFLLLGKPIEHIDEQIVQLSKILFIMFLLCLIILILITNWLTDKILSPFQNIIKNISKVNSSNLSMKIPVPKEKDEIYFLVSSLNEMLERLDKQFKREKEFMSNISHELKTPLTIILLSLEKLIQNSAISEKDKKEIVQIYITIQRLSLLIKNLLMLLSLESNMQFKNFKKMNLTCLIKELLEIYDIKIKQKKIKLEKNMEEIFIVGSRELIKRMFMNLLDNAIKYSNKNGIVKINLYKEDIKVVLSIYNSGKGITSDKIYLIFDRFYQIDQSRTNREGSFGLGLSIVKEIVKVHKGEITVDSDGETYTEFKVMLPINME
ncbi:sensor histidine kinase [Deferribacter desulfuricans]|nr:HAMP domain-containing sensor histidine kinase [Deferribacter desulfuricans]